MIRVIIFVLLVVYMDSVQKIFPGNGYSIGVLGLHNVGNYNISYLTKDFTDSAQKIDNFSWLYSDWVTHLQNKLPNNKMNLDSMLLLFVFYQKGVPNIHIYHRNGGIV